MLAQTPLQKGKGGNGLLICDGRHFCEKNRYFCNVSQQVLSQVVAVFLVELHWPVVLLSLFLCLFSSSILKICGHDN